MASQCFSRALGKDPEMTTFHCLKGTALSWAGKGGLNAETRQVLGHHSTGKHSHEIYNRDLLAEPMRQLELILQRIRTGSFLPDASRSGMITEATVEDPCFIRSPFLDSTIEDGNLFRVSKRSKEQSARSCANTCRGERLRGKWDHLVGKVGICSLSSRTDSNRCAIAAIDSSCFVEPRKHCILEKADLRVSDTSL